jgi:hypothetical protein
MATGSAPGVCCLCPQTPYGPRTPSTSAYTDSTGYTYHLCDRHYRPIRRWLQRLAEREAKRLAGGILTAEDFLRDDPDGR